MCRTQFIFYQFSNTEESSFSLLNLIGSGTVKHFSLSPSKVKKSSESKLENRRMKFSQSGKTAAHCALKHKYVLAIATFSDGYFSFFPHGKIPNVPIKK